MHAREVMRSHFLEFTIILSKKLTIIFGRTEDKGQATHFYFQNKSPTHVCASKLLTSKKQTSTKCTLTFGAFSEFSPERNGILFICIEAQQGSTTTSGDLDPGETLLYSKVI